MSLGKSGPGVRSGFLETPRTRFGGVFLASAQTASQSAVPGLRRLVKNSPVNGTSATMSIGISEPLGGW